MSWWLLLFEQEPSTHPNGYLMEVCGKKLIFLIFLVEILTYCGHFVKTKGFFFLHTPLLTEVCRKLIFFTCGENFLLNIHLDVCSAPVRRGEATCSWKKATCDMSTGIMRNLQRLPIIELGLFRSDVDDSGDILISTLLRGWIRLSPIVNPIYLISYSFIIQYVYKLLFLGVLERYWGLGHMSEVLYLFTSRYMHCRLVRVSLFTLHGVPILHWVCVLCHGGSKWLQY